MRPAETEVEVDAASAEAAAAEAAAAEAQALKLFSMGFERLQVHEALRRSGGRLEAAVQMLLDAPDGQLPLDAPDGQLPPDAPDGQVPPEASGAALGAGAPSAPLCRWLWSSGSGADERWTPYSALESEEIERLFAAGIDRCFVAADRHIDFKTLRQVRHDAPSRYRAVRREANASSDGASAPVPVVTQPAAPPSSVPRVFAPPDAVTAIAAPPPPAVVRGVDGCLHAGARHGARETGGQPAVVRGASSAVSDDRSEASIMWAEAICGDINVGALPTATATPAADSSAEAAVGYELKVFRFEEGSLGMRIDVELQNGATEVKVLEIIPGSQAEDAHVPIGSIIMLVGKLDVTPMKSFAEFTDAIALEPRPLEITMAVPLSMSASMQVLATAPGRREDIPLAVPLSVELAAEAYTQLHPAPAASAVPVRPVGLARTDSTGVAYVPPALQRTPSAGGAAAAALAAAAEAEDASELRQLRQPGAAEAEAEEVALRESAKAEAARWLGALSKAEKEAAAVAKKAEKEAAEAAKKAEKEAAAAAKRAEMEAAAAAKRAENEAAAAVAAAKKAEMEAAAAAKRAEMEAAAAAKRAEKEAAAAAKKAVKERPRTNLEGARDPPAAPPSHPLAPPSHPLARSAPVDEASSTTAPAVAATAAAVGADPPERFVARELLLGQAEEAAEGLNAALGIDNPQLLGRLLQQGHEAVVTEFLEHGSDEDQANLEYVLHGVAQRDADLPAHVKADYAKGSYHGGSLRPGDYDYGHAGMCLEDFVGHEHSRLARLTKAHLLALRMYTTSSYARIH